MIAIVNYGLGNVQAIANIYKRLNIEAGVVFSPDELRAADRVILPGVGAFDWAMTRLNESGIRDVLNELVIGKAKPILGICVGMQIMAKRSDEGMLAGLSWIDAEVRIFERGVRSEELGGKNLSLPHMGWNDVVPRVTDGLFKNLGSDARFYFLHSYYFLPRNQDQVLAVTDYNGPFASSVRNGNVFGVQFHPEKSHKWGIQLLKNFAEM